MVPNYREQVSKWVKQGLLEWTATWSDHARNFLALLVMAGEGSGVFRLPVWAVATGDSLSGGCCLSACLVSHWACLPEASVAWGMQEGGSGLGRWHSQDKNHIFCFQLRQ